MEAQLNEAKTLNYTYISIVSARCSALNAPNNVVITFSRGEELYNTVKQDIYNLKWLQSAGRYKSQENISWLWYLFIFFFLFSSRFFLCCAV